MREDKRLTSRVDGEEGREARADETAGFRASADLTDQERVDMFSSQFMQSALPDIPPIPGYHVCWLTTTSKFDPIQARQRIGYTPVEKSDLPVDLQYLSAKSGEMLGLITVNEMVAYKIPLPLYQSMMKAVHHDVPRQQEEGIVSTYEGLKKQNGSSRKTQDTIEAEMDGMEQLRKQPRAPSPESWGTR